MTNKASNLPDEVLGHLQHTILWSVLSGEALPGGRRPVKMPDLSFVLRRSPVLMSSENLAKSLSLETLPVPVRISSVEDLADKASEGEEVAYLRFQPALKEDGTIRVTLEAKIIPRDTGQRALGLGGVQVKFAKANGQWLAVEEPRFFAT